MDINVFNPNICFVIFFWMKYVLHVLVDIHKLLKMWNVQESTMSAYKVSKDETLEMSIHYKKEVEK